MSLVVTTLGVRYGNVVASTDVSFRCAPGQLVCIVGPNGAGKSSTLNAISGAQRRGVTGTVVVDDVPVHKLDPERVVRRGLSHVPEGRRIFGGLSVVENLLLGAITRKDRREAAQEAAAMLERFPSLGKRRDSRAGLLSGGEAQQLAIARALLARPRYLLLDEPSLGLAPLVVEQILDLVIELRDEGLGIVLVEQNALASLAIADQAYLMLHGHLREQSANATGDDLMASYFGHETGARLGTQLETGDAS